MKNAKILAILVLALGLMVWPVSVSQAEPMGTAFTYQGRLIDSNSAADGEHDFAFKLYDADVGGGKVGNDVNVGNVDVIDGYFTVGLDFGSGVFDGNAVWLEIGVRPGEMNDPNVYTTLSPRQEVTPTPYALYAASAGSDSDWMISGNDMYSIPSGNVGIGTTSPVDLLEVASDSLAAVTLSTYSSAGADNPSELVLRRARGTMAAPSAILSGDVIGWIFGDGYGSTTWPDIGPGINFVATENWTDTALGSRIGFYTIRNGTNVEVEAMRIDQSGNVGIETTKPETKLHVYESSSSDVYMSVEASSSDSEAGVRLKNPAGGWDVFANNDDGDFGIAHALAERVLTIKNSTGNVGIGTTSPGAKLQVGDTSAGHDVYIAGSTNSESGLFFYDGGIPGGMRYNFSTDDLSIFTAGTARLMINSSGDVGIGTTNPQHKVHVSGNVYTSGNTYTAGRVGIGTTSPGWEVHVVGDIAYTGDVYDISDSRLKENITPLRNAIEKVSSLCGIYFNNKGESPSKREVGVIAQDVEAVLPEVVSENNEGYKVVAYSKLTALLIEAVKEQQKQIESLEQRIENLENTASRSRLSAAKEIYNGTN